MIDKQYIIKTPSFLAMKVVIFTLPYIFNN